MGFWAAGVCFGVLGGSSVGVTQIECWECETASQLMQHMACALLLPRPVWIVGRARESFCVLATPRLSHSALRCCVSSFLLTFFCAPGDLLCCCCWWWSVGCVSHHRADVSPRADPLPVELFPSQLGVEKRCVLFCFGPIGSAGQGGWGIIAQDSSVCALAICSLARQVRVVSEVCWGCGWCFFLEVL